MYISLYYIYIYIYREREIDMCVYIYIYIYIANTLYYVLSYDEVSAWRVRGPQSRPGARRRGRMRV